MKKYFLFILISCISLSISAQHLKFMGLPIDGTITSFNSKLLTKGFRISPKNKTEGPGARVYRGKFANMPCDITMQYSTKTNIVFACNAVSDDSDDFISIIETYTKLVDDYEFKYGSKVVKKEVSKKQLTEEGLFYNTR